MDAKEGCVGSPIFKQIKFQGVNLFMAMGRGNAANASTALGLVLVGLLFLNGELVESTQYTVGDANGWTTGVTNWPQGKRFYGGDTLLFKYGPGYNVKRVDFIGYKFCQGESAMDTYTTGNDVVTLQKGYNNFISSIPNNVCNDGMKIAIIAE